MPAPRLPASQWFAHFQNELEPKEMGQSELQFLVVGMALPGAVRPGEGYQQAVHRSAAYHGRGRDLIFEPGADGQYAPCRARAPLAAVEHAARPAHDEGRRPRPAIEIVAT